MTVHLTRRQALAGLAAVAALAGCRRAEATPPPAATTADLTALEHRYAARIGMHATDLNSGAVLDFRADERFAMCSTFKTYAAARVLQLSDHGQLDLDEPVPVLGDEIVANSPVTSTHVGASMTVAQLCEAALTKSDNTAGNLLLRRIGGPSAITTFARSVGDGESRLDRWETELNAALPGDPRDTTTARALAAGYRQVLAGAPGTAWTDTSRRRLLDWMKANTTSEKRFRAGLPPGWRSADKTGAGDFGSTNDAGLLIGPAGQQILLVVLTRSLDDRADAGPFNGAIADTVRFTLETFNSR